MVLFYCAFCFGQPKPKAKTIHVFVALCDNVNQGIVPVSSKLGNGQDPFNNLYWGALYGVKTHFKRSKDWTLVSTQKNPKEYILERVLFKHTTTNTFLLADAYDGKFIKQAITDFLEASAGRNSIKVNEKVFGGTSNLLAYVGHDGLMEFDVSGHFLPLNKEKRDAIILACVSKTYFAPYLSITKANPLVWSTGLMSPEAYTLKWAVDGWINNETDAQIRERAAQAYHKYQKCGVNGARRLLVTGN
ncbi:hypothetical protein FUA24_22735 [Seonamhaeicola marinus]|uniref:Uncharacterized protein n=1 Tax=Seonamhaeicola marinus TaxID=1912246 RepID=A0A5D0HFX7_9FLAO|nr:hypothetical protein FUA24_22735 [Seonamhaeicola marinus]